MRFRSCKIFERHSIPLFPIRLIADWVFKQNRKICTFLVGNTRLQYNHMHVVAVNMLLTHGMLNTGKNESLKCLYCLNFGKKCGSECYHFYAPFIDVYKLNRLQCMNTITTNLKHI